MPSVGSRRRMISIHSFLGTLLRILYWLSFILIIFFDIWTVRWKDWGIIRPNKSTKPIKIEDIKIKQNTDKQENKDNILKKQETESLTDTSEYSNSLNLIPLLLFHSTYFLLTYISFFNINYRPIVTDSNIGLHNAIHHNYFFLGQEVHFLENKYIKDQFNENLKKGGFHCGFWGDGRNRSAQKPVYGFFHSMLNLIKWDEKYFGNFFEENRHFKEFSKITEYGIGSIILDRFFLELIVYTLVAILGLILGGTKATVSPVSTSEKLKDDEEMPKKTDGKTKESEKNDSKKIKEEKNTKSDKGMDQKKQLSK